jgi:hypothetical protein
MTAIMTIMAIKPSLSWHRRYYRISAIIAAGLAWKLPSPY